MLYDENFLHQLNLSKNKMTYARITALDKYDLPLEYIEGQVISGNINIDGKSAVRRTCSLQITATNINIDEYYWTLKNRFKLEIGLINNINKNYPNIIWFPQGIFIITSFSNSLSTNAYNISISGKDKMCLLNGEVGGKFNSQIDFGKEDIEQADGIYIHHYLLIKDIIREMIHQYGEEPFNNIIINDLDETGLELEEYRGDQPTYMFLNMETNTFDQWTFDGNIKCKIVNTNQNTTISQIQFYSLSTLGTDNGDIIVLENDNTEYKITKIEYGDTVGYRETDLTYPGDLIAQPGETITSILDKIVKMLNDYEYFYNIDGQFIFQKKQINLLQNFSLDDELLMSFNSTPQLQNIKNDYSIWGNRKGISNKDLPIHYRYAIDIKPTKYTTIHITQEEANNYNAIYQTNLKPQTSVEYNTNDFDWRELIYQMSQDYKKANHFNNFEAKIIEANGDLYPFGKTGYEQYYIDLDGSWRDIYDPNNKDGKYYTEGENKYFNKDIIEAPDKLNFYFDFLTPAGDIEKYSTQSIGIRPQVEKNSNIHSIFYKITPQVIFISKDEEKTKTGYTYFNMPSLENMFSMSPQGLSAEDVLKTQLNKHTYGNEQVTIESIPIYYLEPNTYVNFNNKELNIIGLYLISKISLSLAYNGTSSITASKVVNDIF